jgi:hypothetical protein
MSNVSWIHSVLLPAETGSNAAHTTGNRSRERYSSLILSQVRAYGSLSIQELGIGSNLVVLLRRRKKRQKRNILNAIGPSADPTAEKHIPL